MDRQSLPKRFIGFHPVRRDDSRLRNVEIYNTPPPYCIKLDWTLNFEIIRISNCKIFAVCNVTPLITISWTVQKSRFPSFPLNLLFYAHNSSIFVVHHSLIHSVSNETLQNLQISVFALAICRFLLSTFFAFVTRKASHKSYIAFYINL